MSKKNNGGFLLGAIIGGAAAAAAALLMAPKAGKETREELLEQMDDLKAKSSDYTQLAKEKGNKALSKAQDIKDSTLSTLKKNSEELADDLKETVEKSEWEERLDNLVDGAQDIVLDVKEMSGKAVDHAQDMAADVKDGVKSAFDKSETEELVADAKDTVDETVDTAKDVAEEVVTAAKETTEDVKDDINHHLG
ncbi:YtxH domain-containing protein [Vagococcus xieshaowenii]|uniref:YtxH domain-containing protein n=1 Tax=Vagococcus xieshaowenii TaxID=2562451 RepID=A0AAJ5EHD3_9ENTE|nr:YtxH domain-containing protein [Vagococcus xieshaowenii]QCA28795.1 YtxH domain-containing protein [Vagococcus xieshaowenii]TFZ43004.1 YtxH domain-containing protein [Vagococcus xieshaowenii]